jgi:hypothetical protein
MTPGCQMRSINIGPFPERVDPTVPLAKLIKDRLSNSLVQFPSQAVELVAVMAWPDDLSKRAKWTRAHLPVTKTGISADPAALNRLSGYWTVDQGAVSEFLPELRKIQQRWLRIADIVHLHFDLHRGGHQRRRGNASVSKTIALIDCFAHSRGTGEARLWELWSRYKDSAHLIAATVLISAEARTLHQSDPLLSDSKFVAPYPIAMLLPDLVLSVGMAFEDHGLRFRPHSREETMLAANTAWRIPRSINLLPIEPPTRKIPPHQLAFLGARRAGNRGRANLRKTTPVSRVPQ